MDEEKFGNRDDEDCTMMYLLVMLTIVGGSICIIGLICNALSLCVFCRGVAYIPNSYQLIWLVVVDSILLPTWFVIVPLYYANAYFYDFERDLLYWRVIEPISSAIIIPVCATAHTCKLWLTVFIAVFQYLAVVKPFTNQHSHIERQGQKYGVLVLCMAVLYNATRFWRGYLERVEGTDGLVRFYFRTRNLDVRLYYYLVYDSIMFTVLFTGLPLIILIIVTAKILVAMKKRQNNSQGNINVILITIFITLLICQTPVLVAKILKPAVSKSFPLCGSMWRFAQGMEVFLVLNSAANPFIYFGVSKQLRSSLALPYQSTRNNGPETIEMDQM